ncbi:nickel ABC transporter permease [Sinanaerobacter sp. ZZT-01]|uniref:nickel ABC transporter permease n=1 Tax=Sinanaerobacter sp. ZZT-01 TaxID=3111540 RepID=UPI002D79B199|nr:nickel ABC transporter permease [Sinanaerobacter sp. ZZT-01]WRR93437.1 nickel ABC transporter permease [Sinanaerobacter sp. ZZT-01]
MSGTKLRNRLFETIIVLFGISFITFGLTYLAPGDPVRTMYAVSGSIPSEEILEQTRESMGLNKPFFIQYWNWLAGCLRGDFGISYSMNRPVADIILVRLWPTLKLAFTSLAFMILVSVPLGMLAAVKRNRVADYLIRSGTFLGISIPNFWVGMLLLYVVAVKFKLVSVVSMGNGIEKLILPAVTLAFAMSAKYTRQVRTAVLEELNQEYVIGARARGIKESIILWKHIFPNALLPLITLLGLSLGNLLGGTAVVEVIFSYQGLGNLAVSAIKAYDYPLIQAYVIWIAVIYMVINGLVDISYSYLDPRIRKRSEI